MVKYRIKVMPWKGKLLYMPQSYNGFFWGYSDMFYLGSQSNYSDWQMGYMGSEYGAKKYIQEYNERRLLEGEKVSAEKKFAGENPIYYIEVKL